VEAPRWSPLVEAGWEQRAKALLGPLLDAGVLSDAGMDQVVRLGARA
jgi:hypothetical protein